MNSLWKMFFFKKKGFRNLVAYVAHQQPQSTHADQRVEIRRYSFPSQQLLNEHSSLFNPFLYQEGALRHHCQKRGGGLNAVPFIAAFSCPHCIFLYTPSHSQGSGGYSQDKMQ